MAQEHTGQTGTGINKYEDIIQNAAKANGLDPKLLKAVIQQESGFNTYAQSPAGAQGLMQIMPIHGLVNPFNPVENVNYGAKYLRQQIDKFGSVELGLAAYNAGPGNVQKYDGIPPFQETQNYVKKIMANFTGTGVVGESGESTTAAGEPDTALGKTVFAIIRALLIALIAIVGIVFLMKAFPVTNQVLDVVGPNPMGKIKAVKKVVKHSK